ncbi:MAG: DUF3696 domain-containing protein [Flavisolibacter sp.]|nr:DUF3696 domain-containing protein [Flavisolibacter sp.]
MKVLFTYRNGKDLNIADLGFGSSQIIPILLRIAINAYKNFEPASGDYKPSIICIEEPEANLHPALQSKLADLFIDAADKFNIQFILETHSEYLIRKMQYWVAKKIIEPGAAAIYYFYDPQNIPEGEKQIKRINIREDGMLEDDFGEGFYDEATRLTFELLKIQNLNQ